MRSKSTIVGLATAVALGFFATASANNTDRDRDRERGGFVAACSLTGVNPALHPEIFGNPAVAASFGFVKGRDGTWQVMPNCRPH
jgi:hypothetical protein